MRDAGSRLRAPHRHDGAVGLVCGPTYFGGIDTREIADRFKRRAARTHERLEGCDVLGRRRVDPIGEGVDDEPGDAEPERAVDEHLAVVGLVVADGLRSEEHTSELKSVMSI